MKKLQIIADSVSLDTVMDVLNESSVRRFTVTELKEFGLGTQAAVFRGQAYNLQFKARVSVEAILAAETVPVVLAALRKAVPLARQLEVYVSPVESVDIAVQTKSSLFAEVGVN